jgi:hypothetical protein
MFVRGDRWSYAHAYSDCVMTSFSFLKLSIKELI